MALLGELAVNLVARTTKFEQGLKKGTTSLGKMRTSAEKGTKSLGLMKTAIGGLAAAFTTGFIAKSIFETAEAVDELGKKSQLLGLSTEALGGLRHAAEQTGVEVRTLDMALQRMVRRVSEAAQGTGEAKDAIAELGLSAQHLATLQADEQFAAIADAMKLVEDQSDRVRLGFKLFDSEGVKLVNTLKLGSKGLQDMQTEAEKLGILVSGEEAKNMAKFNDEMDRLSKFFKGGKQALVIDVAPALVETVEGLNLLLSDVKELQGPTLPGDSRIPKVPGFIRQLDPVRATGDALRDIVNQGFERGGGTFGAPAIQENELLQRRPANFVEARSRRTPGELRELRIQELAELRKESKRGDEQAAAQRDAMIRGLNNLSVQQTTTTTNTIGP